MTDLVAHLAAFTRALRSRGIRVGVSDAADAAHALTLVDLLDRNEVRLALISSLKIRRSDSSVFDELFRQFWIDDEMALAHADAPVEDSVPAGPSNRRQSPLGTTGHSEDETAERRDSTAAAQLPGYSPDALLRRKPFDECTAADLAEMERLLARLTIELATLPSRRLLPTTGRGFVDLRRSFRNAVATRGDFVRLARRARAREEPHLVLLCDTSGSMDAHSRFLLTFILSLKRVAKRTEAFAFNTTLTRLTPWLVPGKIGPTLDRLAAGVPDWSGGTRIGESLAEFVSSYQRTVLDASAVVVILSDGLDRGDPAVLGRAMRAIRARARR
ncbi:MAG: vWA domain-containing protein, partial [Longimicrobiales bacterium]